LPHKKEGLAKAHHHEGDLWPLAFGLVHRRRRRRPAWLQKRGKVGKECGGGDLTALALKQKLFSEEDLRDFDDRWLDGFKQLLWCWRPTENNHSPRK